MTAPFASKEALGQLLKSWAPSYDTYAGLFDHGICDLTQLANASVGTLATLLAKVAKQTEDIEHRMHAEDIITRAKTAGWISGWWRAGRRSKVEGAAGRGRS